MYKKIIKDGQILWPFAKLDKIMPILFSIVVGIWLKITARSNTLWYSCIIKVFYFFFFTFFYRFQPLGKFVLKEKGTK